MLILYHFLQEFVGPSLSPISTEFYFFRLFFQKWAFGADETITFFSVFLMYLRCILCKTWKWAFYSVFLTLLHTYIFNGSTSKIVSKSSKNWNLQKVHTKTSLFDGFLMHFLSMVQLVHGMFQMLRTWLICFVMQFL